MEVKTERRALLRTIAVVLIERINYRLLQLSEILQPLWATQHNVVFIEVFD
jgi:hypothetical protein